MARYLFSFLAALALLAGVSVLPSVEYDLITGAKADSSPQYDRGGRPMRVQRMTGSQITFPATYDAFDFEFESDYVQLCVHPGSAAVFIRFGTGVSGDTVDIEGTPANYVTSSTVFQTGIDSGGSGGTTYGNIAGRAFAVTVSPDLLQESNAILGVALDTLCQSHPWSTRGLVLNVNTAGTATLDVNAFTSR